MFFLKYGPWVLGGFCNISKPASFCPLSRLNMFILISLIKSFDNHIVKFFEFVLIQSTHTVTI